MGWQIGGSRPCNRHFRIASGADPHNLLPKRSKTSGERQTETTEDAESVIVPGSPQDPCRKQYLAMARVIETLRNFPDAFRAVHDLLVSLP